MTVSMIRGKWQCTEYDSVAGHHRRVWVPCLILKVDCDAKNSPTEYAMIALNPEANDKEGGMVIRKVAAHEVRLLRQEIPL